MKQNANGEQSRLVRALGVFGELFELNILFVVSCIPLLTGGAALTALYSVSMKLSEQRENSLHKQYFAAFRANFKRATAYWLLLLLVAGVLLGEVIFVTSFAGALTRFYTVVIIVELAVLSLVLPFLFPLVARYENSFWTTLKNALLLSVSNLGSWIKIVLAWGVPLGITIAQPIVFFYTWYLWLFLLFALIAYGTSFTIRKVFARVAHAQEVPETPEASAH